MEKVEICSGTSFCALVCIELGFDDIVREKLKKQLDHNPSDSPLNTEENELLMFLLYRSIFY